MTIQEVQTTYGCYLECTCDHTAIRLRTQSNGVQIYAIQCLDCGRQLRAVSKQSPEIIEMPNRLPFDTDLAPRWAERQRAHREQQAQAREHARQEKTTEWWVQYNAYLKTTAWRWKRQAVLKRANYWCEGCAGRPATQAHHLTYAHMGDELLFELVAVCEDCHRRIHPEMD